MTDRTQYFHDRWLRDRERLAPIKRITSQAWKRRNRDHIRKYNRDYYQRNAGAYRVARKMGISMPEARELLKAAAERRSRLNKIAQSVYEIQ